MSVTSTALTVTTTPKRIGTSRARRTFLSVHPPASGTVYIGGPTVSSTSGIPLAAGSTPFLVSAEGPDDPIASEDFWIVASSGTPVVAVNEIAK